MKVKVYFSPNQLDELDLRAKTVVVIDVLRASTTICYAMRSGAREIIPVESVAEAMRIVGNLFSTSTLLCGEKGGKRIEGFKLGNSPTEYTPEIVEGKSLILTTTNGAVALTKAKHAKHCFVAGLVNISYAARAIAELPEADRNDLVIVCSGRENDFSLEDALCAGLLIRKTAEIVSSIELTDSARAVLSILNEYGADMYHSLRHSDHGEYLAQIGFETDIRTSSELDSVHVVPVLEHTVIKKKLSW